MNFIKLKQTAKFYTDPQAIGTQDYHRLTLAKNIFFTDGVKDMCEKLQCYWLTDIIFSYHKKLLTQDFSALYLIRTENGKAVFYVTDGNDNIYIIQEIPFTDIEQDINLFIGNNFNEIIVCLPSER